MLADCHESLLQRVVARCDASDLFLLRLVCKRFRDAVARRVRRVKLDDWEEPSHLALAFPRLTSLDLVKLRSKEGSWLAPALVQLPDLRELLGVILSRHAIPAQTLRGLTRLALTGIGAQGQLSRLAVSCTALQRLEISFFGRLNSANLLSAVAQLADTLTHLQLDLERLEVPSDGLQALNTGRLQRLRLSVRHLPANTCQQLASFTSLTSLDLSRNANLRDDDLAHLNALTRLTALSLRKSAVSAAGVAQLSALANLAALNLYQLGGFSGSPEGARDLPAALACFPGLTDLDVSGYKPGNIGSALTSLTRLTRLAAKNTELLCGPLPPLPQLRVLELQKAVYLESQLFHLSGLCSLTRLSLAGRSWENNARLKLSQHGARALTALTGLRHLLSGCALTKGPLEQLATLLMLRALDLDRAELPLGCNLSTLQHMRLERLRLPWKLEAADRLLPGLRVPVMMGRRWEDEQWGAD